MWSPTPDDELPVPSTHPQRQSYLPTYLQDYDVDSPWQREALPPDPSTMQYAHGTQDRQYRAMVRDERDMTPPSSPSSSPVSQDHESMIWEEWRRKGEHRMAERAVVPDTVARASPYYRPWEESVLRTAQVVTPTRLMGSLYNEPTTPALPPDKAPLVWQPVSATTPVQGLQPGVYTQGFMPPSIRPDRSPWLPTSLNCGLQRDTTPQGYHHGADPAHASVDLREQGMMGTLNRMMGELQILRDQVGLASPEFCHSQASGHPLADRPRPDPINQREGYAPASIPEYSLREPVPRSVASWHHSNPTEISKSANLSRPYTYSKPSPMYEPPIPPYGTPPQLPLTCLRERTYRGPIPTIPDFGRRDPSEFTRLKMALENLLPPDATELFRYQVLLDHLKLDEARLVADAYLNSPNPYSDTMAALTDKFGQPQRLALKKIATVLNAPDIRAGDSPAFQRFALQVRALVGMLQTLGPDGAVELQCGSHVERLLSKLPSDLRSEFRRNMYRKSGQGHNLIDFSDWLQYEAWCQDRCRGGR